MKRPLMQTGEGQENVVVLTAVGEFDIPRPLQSMGWCGPPGWTPVLSTPWASQGAANVPLRHPTSIKSFLSTSVDFNQA